MTKLSLEDWTKDVLGREVISLHFWAERHGVITKITHQEHRLLGTLIFVWVKWEDCDVEENIDPRRFSPYVEGSTGGHGLFVL